MLGSMDIIAFVPTRNREEARPFFEKTLGLSFVSDDQWRGSRIPTGTCCR